MPCQFTFTLNSIKYTKHYNILIFVFSSARMYGDVLNLVDAEEEYMSDLRYGQRIATPISAKSRLAVQGLAYHQLSETSSVISCPG